ncbi:MAG: two-component sensor histidine kinase, partial [Bacteroidetes bacterium]|nr:two-component sensor histidine kinase [Bacteroidota bacterium]
MNETSYQMQALLEDLLAYSRVKNAARVFEHTDLREMLSAVLADFNERIKEKQAVVEIKGDLCSLDVIRYQFKQLLANIINNALKFADAGRAPIIKINSEVVNGKMLMIPQLSQECDYCHLTISDNGIGFDPKYNERIFEIFERLNAKDKYPGTGIGLAICKKIIEIHHGRIVAEGVLNKGANFHIYVPMR